MTKIKHTETGKNREKYVDHCRACSMRVFLIDNLFIKSTSPIPIIPCEAK
jgi:hypothetical protein